MLYKKITLSAVFFLVLGLTDLRAQQAVLTAGGKATGSGGTVNYSIGQAVYTTNIGSTGSIAQGVQQPYEISVVSGTKQNPEINLLFSAYPNPTVDFLTLKIEGNVPTQYVLYLYDVLGKLLVNKKIVGNETIVVLSHFMAATYFLKVIEGNKEIKTFKIIKL